MRILRVAQKVYPDVKGGGPYHVHAMSRDQAAMGHEVTVLTVRHDDSRPHVEDRDGYTVIRYDSATSPLGNDVSPGLVEHLASVDDYHVMHAHSHVYLATNLAAVKRSVGEIPLAITNHGLYSQTAPEAAFNLYLRSLGRWTFNRADLVFCYTDTDEQRIRDLGVSSQIAVVPNGIDVERFSPDGQVTASTDHDGPVVLFVGRLVDGKRPSLALEAFAAICDQYPSAKLRVCGTGPLRDRLERKAASLSIEDAVEWLGHIPYDEMPAVYASGDAMILPSRAEGVPRTVLEAKAAGLSVVCGDLPQLTKILTEHDQIIRTTDASDFADGLLESIETTSNRHLTDQGVFDWQSTVERTTAELHALAKRSAPKTVT